MQKETLKTIPYRVFEISLIFLFIAAAIALIVLLPTQSGISQKSDVISGISNTTGTVQAIASYMPIQGWTPLTVNFSAYDSYSTNGSIVKYEWDLDGNGRFDTDATSNGGYASYSYLDNGVYTVNLRVTDEKGFTDTASIPVNVRHPNSSSVDYWTVFDDSQVRKVEVKVKQSDWDLMWSDIEAKHEVPADAVVFGEKLDDVGFSMRGQFSLRESGEKKPWKINTDVYIADQEFHNLRQLIFTNNMGDASMLMEKLSYDMMYFAGVPASHVCFVELWIDIIDDINPPIFWGIYTMIERVDRKFLGNRFGQDSKDGNLYKASHAQRGPMDLAYYGDSIEDYPTQNGQYAYGKENNLEEADYSDITNLCYVVDGAEYQTPEEFAEALEEIFNVDSFLRYMAVITLTMNWDSYPNTGNNYFLFNNPFTDKFEWIPWDLTWGSSVETPVFQRSTSEICENAPLFENVFKVEKYRHQFFAYLDLLIREFFNYEDIYIRAKEYHDIIEPYVSQGDGDKMYYGEGAWFTIEEFNSSWQDLADLAQRRADYIREILNEDK
jgi:spore coat protein H